MIYLLSLKHQRGRQNTVFVVIESRSILYSGKIVCLQVDWFTGYNGIMIEHLRINIIIIDLFKVDDKKNLLAVNLLQ